MKQIIMLNTALCAQNLHKETPSEQTEQIVNNFNNWEKRMVIVDEEDKTKDIHYAIKEN